MDEIVATAFWRRLDTEGHDGCRLVCRADGWQLIGCAIFDLEGSPCLLNYRVDADREWRTRKASVSGAAGFDKLELEILSTPAGQWLLNGVAQDVSQAPSDIDLGFTPATNLLAIRRLESQMGVETPAPAAYLAFPELKLVLLKQSYRKTGNNTLAYSAPAYDYSSELTVAQSGFISDYPGLWTGTVCEI